MATRVLKLNNRKKIGITLFIVVLWILAFSACTKEPNAPEKVSTAPTLSQTPTEQQMKLVESMRKRANSGITITATRDILTITEMNNQDKTATIWYLFNLNDNEDFEPVMQNVGFKQLKLIRRFQGRTQVNNYQVDFSKPMTDEAIEYID
jgi:uncharacterized lipoprotein YajG